MRERLQVIAIGIFFLGLAIGTVVLVGAGLTAVSDTARDIAVDLQTQFAGNRTLRAPQSRPGNVAGLSTEAISDLREEARVAYPTLRAPAQASLPFERLTQQESSLEQSQIQPITNANVFIPLTNTRLELAELPDESAGLNAIDCSQLLLRDVLIIDEEIFITTTRAKAVAEVDCSQSEAKKLYLKRL